MTNLLLKNRKILLIFSVLLLIISCSGENEVEIELTEIQQLQNKFSLNNFSDVFVKNNLEVDWDDFESNLDSENKLISYEFNTHFNVRSTIEDYAKYKLLASKNEYNHWNVELIKFSTCKENLYNNISYFTIINFTGSIYHYNLKGENTLIKVYSKGKITEEISFNYSNTLAKAPPIGGGHCLGCWTLARTKHYTDWYINSLGGSTLYYSHSVYNGTTTEWVYIPRNGDYYGMPFDSEDGAYHNHYGYPHGGIRTDNHDNEKIVEEDKIFLDPSFENSFANCAYKLLTENNLLKDILKKLIPKDSKYDITFKVGATSGSGGNTSASYGINGDIIVTINKDLVDTGNVVSISETILHEAVHAKLFEMVKSIGGLDRANAYFFYKKTTNKTDLQLFK